MGWTQGTGLFPFSFLSFFFLSFFSSTFTKTAPRNGEGLEAACEGSAGHPGHTWGRREKHTQTESGRGAGGGRGGQQGWLPEEPPGPAAGLLGHAPTTPVGVRPLCAPAPAAPGSGADLGCFAPAL